jgi:hypothetical protein
MSSCKPIHPLCGHLCPGTGGYFVMYASVWKNYNFKDQVEHWSSTLGWARIKGGSNDLALYQKPLALPSTATPGFPPCPECRS